MGLDARQKSALQQFRSRVGDVPKPKQYDDDLYYLRWLRARNYDVDKAEKMFKDSMALRKHYDLDNMAQGYPVPQLQKYCVCGILEFDKEGCPILLMRCGNLDISGHLQSLKISRFLKTAGYFLEHSEIKAKEQSWKLGRYIDKNYVIFDLEGITMKQMLAATKGDLAQRAITLLEGIYPEIVKKVVVINVSKSFYIFYNIIKSLLPEETKNKICFYTKDNWKEVLLQDIDAEVLPVHWGGKRTDGTGDPTCPTLIPSGGEIPSSLYMAPSSKIDELEDVQRVTVAARSTFEAEVKVSTPGSVLKWIFSSSNYDITYGVYRKSPQGLEIRLLDERVNSHIYAEEDEIKCDLPGAYILRFDNTGSYMRSKKIAYKIEVIPASTFTKGTNEIYSVSEE